MPLLQTEERQEREGSGAVAPTCTTLAAGPAAQTGVSLARQVAELPEERAPQGRLDGDEEGQAARAGGRGLGIGGASVALCMTFSCASRDGTFGASAGDTTSVMAAVTARRRRRTAGMSNWARARPELAARRECPLRRSSPASWPPSGKNVFSAAHGLLDFLFMSCCACCFCQLPHAQRFANI